MVVRRIARPLMAAVFIAGGIDTLRNPASRARKAEPVTEPLTEPLAKVAGVSQIDPRQVVLADAGVKIGAGLLLATNRLPRLSAFLLACSLAPTTVAGHPFWESRDREERAQQRLHFLKNLAILGGLLIAAVDTGGRESVPHKARRALQRNGGR